MAPTSPHSSEGVIDIEAVITKDFTMPESLNITNTCEEIPLASFEYACDPIRWDSSRGLTRLERLDRHYREPQVLRQSLGATQMRVTDLESELSSVKLEMVTLKQESDAYLNLRNRFFATFRKDILQNVLEIDRATISAGHKTALGGDFLTDASLFEKNLRYDDDVLRLLYGLNGNRAASYQDQQEVVSALNLYAGVVADPLYTTQDPKLLKEYLTRFSVSLQNGDYRGFVTLPHSSEKEEAFLKDYRSLPKKYKPGPD